MEKEKEIDVGLDYGEEDVDLKVEEKAAKMDALLMDETIQETSAP